MPMRRAVRAARGGTPPILTWPAVGWSTSAASRNSVDLPHPDGPINETKAPSGTLRLMSSSALTPLG